MKRFVLLIFVTLFVFKANAQFGGYNPVSMEESFTVKGSEGIIRFEASIEDGFHLYSTDIPKGGPMSTNIKFHVLEGAELVGTIIPGEGAKREYDEMFAMDVSYFEGNAVFTQKLKMLGGAYRIKGTVSYQSCGSGQCYLGRHEFEIAGTAGVVDKKQTAETEKQTVDSKVVDKNSREYHWRNVEKELEFFRNRKK